MAQKLQVLFKSKETLQIHIWLHAVRWSNLCSITLSILPLRVFHERHIYSILLNYWVQWWVQVFQSNISHFRQLGLPSLTFQHGIINYEFASTPSLLCTSPFSFYGRFAFTTHQCIPAHNIVPKKDLLPRARMPPHLQSMSVSYRRYQRLFKISLSTEKAHHKSKSNTIRGTLVQC